MLIRLLFAAAIAAPVGATAVIDQVNLADTSLGPISTSSVWPAAGSLIVAQAQTVTAGSAGLLTRIDLQLASVMLQTGGISLGLWDGDYAAGGATLVTSRAVPLSDLPTREQAQAGGLFVWDVSGAGYRVSPGRQFTLRLSFGDGPFRLDRPAASWLIGVFRPDIPDEFGDATQQLLSYSGGQATVTLGDGRVFSAAADRGFRTWVQADAAVVPEPGTWAMMIVGFGLVGRVARRRTVLAA